MDKQLALILISDILLVENPTQAEALKIEQIFSIDNKNYYFAKQTHPIYWKENNVYEIILFHKENVSLFGLFP